MLLLCYVVSTFKQNNPDADAFLKSVLMVCDVGKTSRSWSHDCKSIDDLDAAILYVCTQSKAYFSIGKGGKEWISRGDPPKHDVNTAEMAKIESNLRAAVTFYGHKLHTNVGCASGWLDHEDGCTVNFYVNNDTDGGSSRFYKTFLLCSHYMFHFVFS